MLLCGVSPLRVLVLRTSLVYDEPPRSNLRSRTGERAPRYASLGYQSASLRKMQRSLQLTSRQLVLKLKLSNFISHKEESKHLLVAFFFFTQSASPRKTQRSLQLTSRQLAQKLKNANNNRNQKRFMRDFSRNNAPKILIISCILSRIFDFSCAKTLRLKFTPKDESLGAFDYGCY